MAVMTSAGLRQLVREMTAFDQDGEYYALTLTARGDQLLRSVQSHFVGFSERRPEWELRAASLVDPGKMSGLWRSIGQSWVSVHSRWHMSHYLRLGGNALVEKSYGDENYPRLFEIRESVHDGNIILGGAGFLSTGQMPDSAATDRALSRKNRLAVLKRDDYRCSICGRRARDNSDIELAVHHIIPWRMAGPTHPDNMITLCGTCHKGLDPDYDPKLREFADVPGPSDPIDFSGDAFRRDVEDYRALVARTIEEYRPD